MNGLMAIYQKEVLTYFRSPIAGLPMVHWNERRS